MNSKYLFLIETLYMTIDSGCHYICSLVLRQTFTSGITFLKPKIRMCVINGHSNCPARSYSSSKHELRP